ncbi:MAG: hypothetical protein ACKVHO_11065 [Verrucomicrobiia bacterium]|jgi:hypothetical protein
MKAALRLVISCTTSPGRIQLFRPVVQSILDQTVVADAIYLHLPQRFRNTDVYEIPAWLSAEKRIQINRIGHDFGPISKLLPVLKLEPDPATIIVTVDDDVVFPKDVMQAFLAATMADPGSAYCSKGFSFDCHTQKINPVRGELAACDCVQGFSGCCYRRGHFCQDTLLKDVKSIPTKFLINDDLLLSNHIAGNGISRRTVTLSDPLEFMPWSDDDPNALKLADGGTHRRYQQLRSHLQAHGEWHLTDGTY